MLDGAARLHLGPGGGLLVGGQPLRVLRLSEPAAAVVARWRDGGPVSSAAELVLARRLHHAGLALHTTAPVHRPEDVTVVVPVHDRVADLERCLTALGPGVLVVDDASLDGRAVREVALRCGARLVRRATNGGPGAARNTGLAEVRTPLVAFVDSDVVVPGGWLAGLLPVLQHDVAVVAPRVVGAGGVGVLARYESGAGPLDLGPVAGPVRPGARVGHVPAAALLCRVTDLGAGFEESMRVGEDVDLLWRLVAAGKQVRYEPGVVVTHRTRTQVLPWLAQRHGYGRSAAALDVRHPGAVPPVVLDSWSIAALVAPLARRPALALLVIAAHAAGLHGRLPDAPGRSVEAVRLATGAPVSALLHLAEGAARAWLPVALPLCLFSRRVRTATAVALAVRLARVRRGDTRVGASRRAGLVVAEDLAYASGLWRGAVERRRPLAVLPRMRRRLPPTATDGH